MVFLFFPDGRYKHKNFKKEETIALKVDVLSYAM